MRHMLVRHRSAPFEWGKSDCTMFADVVVVMTGFDPIADFRGYRNQLGALRMLKLAGVESMIDYVAQLFPEIPASMAMRGDLAFAADATGPLMCPAVVDGAMAHSKNQDGPVMWPRANLTRAFAV